jgi:hypothetical protein
LGMGDLLLKGSHKKKRVRKRADIRDGILRYGAQFLIIFWLTFQMCCSLVLFLIRRYLDSLCPMWKNPDRTYGCCKDHTTLFYCWGGRGQSGVGAATWSRLKREDSLFSKYFKPPVTCMWGGVWMVPGPGWLLILHMHLFSGTLTSHGKKFT